MLSGCGSVRVDSLGWGDGVERAVEVSWSSYPCGVDELHQA